jgi:hypothetical protein
MSGKIYWTYSTENTLEFWLAIKIHNIYYTKHNGYSWDRIINCETKILIKKLHGANRAAEFDSENKTNRLNGVILKENFNSITSNITLFI